jgi:hypothetical protein
MTLVGIALGTLPVNRLLLNTRTRGKPASSQAKIRAIQEPKLLSQANS